MKNYNKANRKNKPSGRKRTAKKQEKKRSILNIYEQKILKALKRDKEKEFSSRELLRKSEIKDKDMFYKSLNKLAEMDLIFVKNHKVKLNNIPTEVVAEVFSLSRGFAFVRPTDGSDDIFIPGRDLKSALVGDKVLVSNIKKDDKGFSGRIVKIIDSANKTCTGTVIKTTLGYELMPDTKIRYNLEITDLAGANVGDKVKAEIKLNRNNDWTKAEIIKVFGEAESAKVCSDAIIEQNLIPVEFSEEALKEARAIKRKKITDEDLAQRVDLRDKNIFTIDGKDSKDLDDAINIEKLEDGWFLGVHIADVSHYVRENTALDKEAIERGTSVYFADRVIPMLPKEISNGTCSLTAGKDKLCFSAFITLTEEGEIRKYEFKKTVINSKVKGIYDEVNKILSGKPTARLKTKYADVLEEIELARKLAKILEKNAKKRGHMDLESDETKFILDKDGVCIGLKARESGESEKMIEQFMITANICAARYSKDVAIPFLYRVHEAPQAHNIRELTDLLKLLGIPCKELLKENPQSHDMNAVLIRAKETDYSKAVSKKILQTMEKAKYSTELLGHYGLSLKFYSHFTSPIRRYPDTTIHRLLTALSEGMANTQITRKYSNFCDNSAMESSNHEVRAVTAVRQAEDCYVAEFMKQHIGESFVGTVSSVLKSGVFVRLDNSAEGFVSLDSFDERFVFDGLISMRSTVGKKTISIGTTMEVTVISATVANGKVDFAFKSWVG